MTTSTQFIVAKDSLQDSKFITTALPAHDELPEDFLLLKVDRFAFTANNITYALLGDTLKYWQLFPAPKDYGIIPVWGFAEVLVSKHPQIVVGERLFGYMPMASHLIIEAGDVSKRGLRDAAAHRQGVAPVYNAYARVSADPGFAGRQGDYQALLRPLFMLSFLVDDYLAEEKFFGAQAVILSSASSKTAFGLAHLLHAQRQPIRVIGLTSASNTDFVAALGCYDEVVGYDDIAAMPTDAPVAFVDMAGNGAIRARLHHHFGDRLVHSARIGLAHQDESAADADLPGPPPTWFFAPDQIRKRAKDWGPGGIEKRLGAAWTGFAPLLERAVTVVEGHGTAKVAEAYQAVLEGRTPPNQGHILSFWP